MDETPEQPGSGAQIINTIHAELKYSTQLHDSMIQNKDFIMRMIAQIGNAIAKLLKLKSKEAKIEVVENGLSELLDEDEIGEIESDDLLEACNGNTELLEGVSNMLMEVTKGSINEILG